MKAILILFALVEFSLAANKAADCVADQCKIENNCRCSSRQCPIDSQTAPQLIALTFIESVTNELFNNYWSPLLLDRVNPDGVPIGATFFVPHEYTDYQRVLDLYNYGFEIGVHSITKNSDQAYWRSATVDTLEKEFGGQKTIISTFANIPKADIVGARTPQLQLAGNNSFTAFVNAELIYDSTWPTRGQSPLFPYTLDFLSTQECVLGSACPNEQFKGFWEAPIIDLTAANNTQCNTLAGCDMQGTSQQIADWLVDQILVVRNDTRAPMTLIVESHWFEKSTSAFEGLGMAMDRLIAYKDVFFVSQKQVIDWTKNPVPTSDFKTEYADNRSQSCRPVSCELTTTKGEKRYMNACVNCPTNYPWLGNPLGQ